MVEKKKETPEGIEDHVLTSQVPGSVLPAQTPFNSHPWALNFSWLVSFAARGKQLGAMRELTTPSGALLLHGLPGSCTLVWSFTAASSKYKIYYFVPHLLGG